MLALSRETGASHVLFVGLVGFGVVVCFGGDSERGVRLIATGETLLRQGGLDLSNMPGGGGGAGFMVLGQTVERARAQLGPAFELAWAEGQQLTLEQALALATEDDSVDAPLPEAGRRPATDSPAPPSAASV